MMKFRENEDAVSPVIGVILMVAITVILAAVIAAFVFGMTDNLTPQKEVYVTTKLGVDTNDEPVMIVTLQGGKDISSLDNIQVSDNDAGFENLDTPFTKYEVGSSGSFKVTNDGTNHRYVIRGVFTDGTEKVLAEKNYQGSSPEE
jgi:flagellin-like protein